MLQTATAGQPSSLAHTTQSNKPTLDDYKVKARELGEQCGKGKDTQVKFLLSCMEGGYYGGVDLVPGRHGVDRDDATVLAEEYVKAQGTATVFDSKSPNQRKLISTLRTAIKLGGYTKGGQGEPLATVGQLMSERQKLRKDPVQAKKLDDAANTLLKFAREQLKRDTMIDPDEFKQFLYKPGKETPTAEEVVESMRNSLQKLVNGRKDGVQDNSTEIRDAVQALTKRLTAIAKAKGAQKPGGAK